MSLESLEELFIEELRDIYNGEKQILRALPKMAKAAESPELGDAFTKHLKETEGQVQRLERIFQGLGQAVRGKTFKGIQGILEEGKELLEKEDPGPVLDAALVAGAQKVEHYEMAVYGCLRTYAQLLGNDEAARLLEQTLNEEEAADQKLTQLGESGINEAAVVGSSEEEEE